MEGFTPQESNMLIRASEFWIRSAERKRDVIRRMQVEAADADRELTVPEAADVEYINTRLPNNIDALTQAIHKIKERAGE